MPKRYGQGPQAREEAEDRTVPDGALASVAKLQEWTIAVGKIELAGAPGSAGTVRSVWIGGKPYHPRDAPRARREFEKEQRREEERVRGGEGRVGNLSGLNGGIQARWSSERRGGNQRGLGEEESHRPDAFEGRSGGYVQPRAFAGLHGTPRNRCLEVEQPTKRKLMETEPSERATTYVGKKPRIETPLWDGPLTPTETRTAYLSTHQSEALQEARMKGDQWFI